MGDAAYIHGTDPAEQVRLSKLGELTDEAFLDFVQLDSRSCVLDVGSGLGNLAKSWPLEFLMDRSVASNGPRSSFPMQPTISRICAFSKSGTAHFLPFEDGGLTLRTVDIPLEHVADPLRVLQEMRAFLSPSPAGRSSCRKTISWLRFCIRMLYVDQQLWRFAELQQMLEAMLSSARSYCRS